MGLIDAAIVGGGPAGLTAANTLARQLQTAVVFDSKSYRNAGTAHLHMILTWDHKNPEEYRSAARRNILANYSTIQFADVAVAQIEKESDSHFKIQDSQGKLWNFRKVILAVGSANTYPAIEGYDRLWKKRIFHCLFCHGYEDKGASSSGVFTLAPIGAAMAVHMGMNAAQLTKQVKFYTNGDDDVAAELATIVTSLVEGRFVIETRQIKRLLENDQANSVTVEFVDGTSNEEKFLVHNPQTHPQGPFVAQLGLATTPMGDIQADAPFYQTNVPGVYAVGDCSTPYKVTSSAITSGCNAGVAASAEIQAANLIIHIRMMNLPVVAWEEVIHSRYLRLLFGRVYYDRSNIDYRDNQSEPKDAHMRGSTPGADEPMPTHANRDVVIQPRGVEPASYSKKLMETGGDDKAK